VTVIGFVLPIVSFVLFAEPGTQQPTNVQHAKFSGEVMHGQDFARDFGSGLVFRLAVSRDPKTPGWTIEIRKKDEGADEVELSSVVTPPHRFWNSRYLDVSYGFSAAEAVGIDVREFLFLRNSADFARAREALAKLLWPNGASDRELDEAESFLNSVPKCTGALRILDHRIVPDAAASERIDWLKFEVELCPGTAP
jgi:hypothetical protein